MASGVELDLLRRVQALEQQVQQLSTTQRDETLQPTYLTINPATGAVGALFTGGVQTPEAAGNPYAAPSAIGWTDNTTASLREYIQGYFGGGIHSLLLNSAPDGADFAQILLNSDEGGGAGASEIFALAQDSTIGLVHSALIINSANQSSFLQLAGGAAQVAVAFGGYATWTWPGGSVASNYQTITVPSGGRTVQVAVVVANQGADAAPLFVSTLNRAAGQFQTNAAFATYQPPPGAQCSFDWIAIG